MNLYSRSRTNDLVVIYQKKVLATTVGARYNMTGQNTTHKISKARHYGQHSTQMKQLTQGNCPMS